MEIKGKIIHKLDLQSGISKAGNEWRKQEYVLETLGSYPKKVKFDFFGERIDQYPLEIGDIITLNYDIESREFNGKWYTEIRGFNAVKEQPQAQQAADVAQPPMPQPAPMPTPTQVQQDLFANNDNLPF